MERAGDRRRVAPEPFLLDREPAQHQRFGLVEALLLAIQPGPREQGERDERMVGPERRHPDLQRAVVQRLGVVIAALDEVEVGQVVERAATSALPGPRVVS